MRFAVSAGVRGPLAAGALLMLMSSRPLSAGRTFDVVVHGATPSGIMAAERQGLSAVLATSHIGGMETGGLNRTDVGGREIIGGLPLEFYWRAELHCDMDRHGKEVSWYPEPHIALAIMKQMLEAGHVTVLCGTDCWRREVSSEAVPLSRKCPWKMVRPLMPKSSLMRPMRAT
jgi:hypothetical protein